MAARVLAELLGRGERPARLRPERALRLPWRFSSPCAGGGLRRDRDLVFAAFTCGLGAANHLEMAVVGIAIGDLRASPSSRECSAEPRLIAACTAAARRGPIALSISALARAGASAARLGTSRHAEELRQGRIALRLLEPQVDPWARRPRHRSSPTTAVAYSPSRLGSERAWQPVAIAAALTRRRRFPVGLPLLVMAGNLVRDGFPRLAERSLHLASLLHPVLPLRCAARSVGMADATRGQPSKPPVRRPAALRPSSS